jgi:hypothetical protein
MSKPIQSGGLPVTAQVIDIRSTPLPKSARRPVNDSHRPEAAEKAPRRANGRPTPAQARWLMRGLDQPGGKLPLFDSRGQRVSRRMVEACMAAGWAEPWFDNPLKPDWLVCRLTEEGRRVALGV